MKPLVIPNSLMALLLTQSAILLLVPIALMIFLCATKRISGRSMFSGIAAFLCASVVSFLITIALGTVTIMQGGAEAMTQNLVVYQLLISLAGSLCMVGVMRLVAGILKKRNTPRTALSAGVGAAMLYVVSTSSAPLGLLFSVSTMSTMNAEMLAAIPEDMQAQMNQSYVLLAQQLNAYNSTAMLLSFLGAACVASFYIFLVLLVFKSARDKKPLGLLLGLLAGVVFPGCIQLLSSLIPARVPSMIIGNGLLAVCAALCWVYIVKAKPWVCRDDIVEAPIAATPMELPTAPPEG